MIAWLFAMKLFAQGVIKMSLPYSCNRSASLSDSTRSSQAIDVEQRTQHLL